MNARDARNSVTQRQHGVILASSLLILTLLSLAIGIALWLLRSELWAMGSARAGLQARYSAEAAVRHAVSLLSPGTRFTALLEGRGGLARPDRPGPLPLAGGGWVYFPGAPFGYGVTIWNDDEPGGVLNRDGNQRIWLLGNGVSVRGAARSVRAAVGRANEPYAPAALVLSGGSLTIGIGGASASLVLDAGETAVENAPAALGAASEASTRSGLEVLRSAGATVIGNPQAVIEPIELSELIASLGAEEESAERLQSGLGSREAPALALVRAGSTAGLSGFGTLVGSSNLELTGEVGFTGVLIVAGTLRLAATPCQLTGMVWAREVVFEAPCTVRWSRDAIGLADRATRLPRRAVLLAMTDA